LKNSSRNPAPGQPERIPDPPLVREAGVSYVADSTRDPFEAFFELMELVEALCPSWPARRNRLSGASFRL
jgi:hypothetical protein